MKKQLYLILFFIGFFSCDTIVEKPENLIDQDKFTAILTDLYLYRNINPTMTKNTQTPNFDDVFGYIAKKHAINGKEFKNSYAYYMVDSKKSTEILEDVKVKLNEKAKELNVGINKPATTETETPINKINYK